MQFISRELSNAELAAERFANFRETTDWDTREVEDRDGMWWTLAEVFTTRDGEMIAAFWSLLK